MYLSATLITIAALSFFVRATPAFSHSGFAVPISKRTLVRDANGVVDIAMLQRNIHHSIAKLHHGFRAYERNTGASHPSAPKAIRSDKRSIGSEPLSDSGHYWYGSISVGTPSKDFTVSFDTGTSDLFLPSSTCDSSCKGHILYNVSESATAQDLGIEFSLGFDDYSKANGLLYTDDVTIAGYAAKDQTLGGVTNYPNRFKYPKWLPDGLLGLGFPSLSIFGAPPVFHNLFTQGALPSNSFGLCPSELYIGGTNDKHYKGNFTYVPVTNEGFWMTVADGLFLDGVQIAGPNAAIIDSGTATIICDDKTVAAFYNQIPGAFPIATQGLSALLYAIPCKFNSEISFQFGATNVTLQPQTINLGHFDTAKPTSCLGGIAGFAITDPTRFWILGDVFLQDVYVELDVGNKRIGFATLA